MKTTDPRINALKQELQPLTKNQLRAICLNFRVTPVLDRYVAMTSILQSPLAISEKLSRIAKIKQGWVISAAMNANNAAANMKTKQNITVQCKPDVFVPTKDMEREEEFQKEIAQLNMEQLLAMCKKLGWGNHSLQQPCFSRQHHQ